MPPRLPLLQSPLRRSVVASRARGRCATILAYARKLAIVPRRLCRWTLGQAGSDARGRGPTSAPRSCDAGGGDLMAKGQEHRAESERLDLDGVEARRTEHGRGLVAQLAPLEQPAPRSPNGSLERRDAGAGRRRHVLDRHAPSAGSEHATPLG